MRVLFIGIDYYEYTARIVGEMRAQGHEVAFHSMELAASRHKLLKRYAPARFARAQRRHHRAILAAEGECAFDKVVFLQVHRMNPEEVAAFRRQFPAAEFVLYNWDSLLTHDYRRYIPYFDRVLTFDRVDATELGAAYRPLFALPEYFGRQTDEPKDADLYFVGTIVTADRLRAVKALRAFCAERGLRLKTHLFCSIAGMIAFLRQGLWAQGLTTRTLPHADIVGLMLSSRAVFDFPNHRQSGYTMRFVENLCAGLKIVTTNALVRDEPFFDADRILVIDNLAFEEIPAFLERASGKLPDLSGFTLSAWVHDVLGTTPDFVENRPL